MEKKKYYKVIDWCISCWSCVSICSQWFEFNDSNVSEAIALNVEDFKKYKSDLEMAQDACPVRVIEKLED